VSKARVFGSCDAGVLLLGCDDGDGRLLFQLRANAVLFWFVLC
jgi:hypothetical protein